MNNQFLNLIFKEDAPQGDITTQAIFGKKKQIARAIILAKEDLVLSGLDAVKQLIKFKFPKVRHECVRKDGERVNDREVIAHLQGSIQDILLLERVILNLLQRLSGIATLTSQFVELNPSEQLKILDTRKTTPGLRDLEKQAVKDGGGVNHRMNLSDQYLIKDNHIQAAGSVSLALEMVLAHQKKTKNKKLIEVEVKTLKELEEALPYFPDIILLDNMSPQQIVKAVKIRNQSLLRPKPELEISGGVNLKNFKNFKNFCNLGVERISIGALTHSARAVDISMEIL